MKYKINVVKLQKTVVKSCFSAPVDFGKLIFLG